MQQKVAIARALLTSPTLLLLDEPTTGLDPRSKLEVQTLHRGAPRRHDATIVLTTHDLAEAERLCDRISILNDGRLVADGDARRAQARWWPSEHGQPPTLEAVFMTYTGRSLDDDVEKRRRPTTRTDHRMTGASRPCHDHARTRRHRDWKEPAEPRCRHLARVIHAERAARAACARRRHRLGFSTGAPRRPIRRPIGRSIIRIGARLAAEQSARARPGPAEDRAGSEPTSETTPLTTLTHELEGELRLRRAQLLPDPALLGLGARVPRVLGRRRPLDLPHRRRAGQRATLLLSLMIGAIFWNYLSVVFCWIAETIAGRALGGHARVHDDGAGPALDPAARLGARTPSSTGWSTRP